MSVNRSKRTPRTARQQATRSRALNSIADLRRGEARSLSEAARQRGTTVRTIRKYTPSAVERSGKSRRWRARPGDTYGSVMAVIVADRQRPERILEVRGSRNRSLVARHRIAVARFLAGEEPALEEFRGVTIRGKVMEPGSADDGEIVELDLLTDPDDIQAHAELNQLTDEGPYALL
jgi:hypothetical protein